MKIKNWIACVQDREKWKEVAEKAKTFKQEVERLEEEEEEKEKEMCTAYSNKLLLNFAAFMMFTD